MKTNSIWSFIGRYWLLLVLLLVTLVPVLPQFEAPFREFGALIYGPVLVTGALVCALLLRHLFFRQSLDEDAHSGYFAAQWRELAPIDRVRLNLLMMAALFLGACLIFAALAK